MSASATSLTLSSLTPKSLSLSNPRFKLLSVNPSSVAFLSNLVSVSSLVVRSDRGFPTLSSRFTRNVAISSDFGQEEGLLEDEGDDYAPDLKLFVGNLPFTVDSAQLAGLFESAGEVQQVEVIYDKTTGRSRGFGFVTMSTAKEVEVAAQQFNGYELEGRSLRVNYGPPPPKKEEFSFRGSSSRNTSNFDNPNRIHVGNLAWGVDDLALENLFKEQGRVVEAKVVYDRESGRSRGFGFVTYSSADEVSSAIEALDGADLKGRQIRVSQAEARTRRQF